MTYSMLDTRFAACCNERMISPAKVIKHFGSVKATADFFHVHPSAVYQWEMKLPRERELELMLRLPEVFPPSKQMTERAA